MDIDFALPGPPFLVLMWAARQVAIARVLGTAVLRRSTPMLWSLRARTPGDRQA